MAIIGKIREKSTLLIVVIGLAMAAFILGDALPGIGGPDQKAFAEVWGNPLDEDDQKEYNDMEQQYVKRVIDRARANGEKPSPVQLKQARDNAWENFIRQRVLNYQLDLLGIEVSPEELTEIVHGNYVDPYLKDPNNFPIFQDTLRDSITGQPMVRNGKVATEFNPALVTQFLNNLENLPEAQYQAWVQVEEFLKENRGYKKYFSLIRHGIYATTLEAKQEFEAVNQQKKIRFVVKKYSESGLSDTALGLTSDEAWDEMVYEFYKEHKDDKEFEQPGSRVFEYVEFNMEMSEIDKQRTQDLMKSMVNRFERAKDDSLFVTTRSESGQWTGNQFTSLSQLSDEARKMVEESDSGDVIGPYFENNSYKIAKVLGKQVNEDNRRASHILIAYQGATRSQATRTKEEAKAIADSLWAKFQNDTTGWHKTVASDITNNSPGTKNKGGDLGYFGEGMMATEFNDFVFNNPVGTRGLVETDFGFHIIQVTDIGESQAKLAIVDAEVKPLKETVDKYMEKAIEFIGKAPDTGFHELAQEYKLPIQSKEVQNEAPVIYGFENNSKLFRWLKGAMAGDVSDPYIVDNKIIVAKLTKIKHKGTPDFEDVKMRMRVPAKEDRLAKRWIQQVQGYNSLEEAGAKLESNVLEANVTFENTAIAGGGGQEPRVVGAIFSNIEDGYLFPDAIQGKYGVYVVEVVETIEPETPADYSAQRTKLHDERRGASSSAQDQIDYKVYEAIKEKADVQDNRDEL